MVDLYFSWPHFSQNFVLQKFYENMTVIELKLSKITNSFRDFNFEIISDLKIPKPFTPP